MTPTPTLREAFEAGYAQGHDATVEGRYVDPSDAATDYLAALSAPEPQGWRPIDEAPKDGTLIATWNPRQASISRFLRWGIPSLAKDHAWITPKGCAPTYLPTHWMPLPEPPQ